MAGGIPIYVDYSVAEDGQSIICHTCWRRSFSPEDVRRRYCGNCHKFHTEQTAHSEAERLMVHIGLLAEKATTKLFQSDTSVCRDHYPTSSLYQCPGCVNQIIQVVMAELIQTTRKR